MTTRYFHFTLGPVQGFVAQARRTRDFWAGSFILSWLSAVAMRAVTAQGGTIVFPKPDENYLKWLEGKGKKERPRQGSVPNRFKAEVKDDFEPLNIEQSVQIAWRKLADLVWRKDLAKHIDEKQTKIVEIWNRQIEYFWEISWALTDNEEKSDLLDRRKNWRNHFAPEEPGFKCMMMDGWQELSGILTPKDNESLKKFWTDNKLNSYDLTKGEHLCAIAFVKRRFVHHFSQLAVKMPGGWTLKGWDLESNVPSASYMAAVHWLETVIKTEETSTLKDLLKAAHYAGARYEEWHTHIACIEAACSNRIEKQLTALDGSVFFPTTLTNKTEEEQVWVKPMLDALKKLSIKQSPSPFYAILLMDGDSLGSKMGTLENQPKISNALQTFTNAVPTIVHDNNGFLVYAGGDDVLAILPLEDALQCANKIRQEYQKAFKAYSGSEIENSTISAAIEFIHINMPLTKVLKDAHNLLDNVAKNGCGRDAIAVRVWKPGGKAMEWASKWNKAVNNQNQFIIEQLAQQFQDKQGNEAAFSSKFFYKIRERFELFQGANIFTEDDECALLATDYLASGVNDTRIKEHKLDLPTAKAEILPLLNQCRQDNFLKPDGALLVRFLANKGIESR